MKIYEYEKNFPLCVLFFLSRKFFWWSDNINYVSDYVMKKTFFYLFRNICVYICCYFYSFFKDSTISSWIWMLLDNIKDYYFIILLFTSFFIWIIFLFLIILSFIIRNFCLINCLLHYSCYFDIVICIYKTQIIFDIHIPSFIILVIYLFYNIFISLISLFLSHTY